MSEARKIQQILTGVQKGFCNLIEENTKLRDGILKAMDALESAGFEHDTLETVRSLTNNLNDDSSYTDMRDALGLIREAVFGQRRPSERLPEPQKEEPNNGTN